MIGQVISGAGKVVAEVDNPKKLFRFGTLDPGTWVQLQKFTPKDFLQHWAKDGGNIILSYCAPRKCSCDLGTLIISGCQCGGA